MDQLAFTGNPVYIDDRIQVLNHCDTFAILNRWGNISPGGKGVEGLYSRDTRFINKLELLINGLRPELLSSNIKEENEILSVDLINPLMVLSNGVSLTPGMLHLRRSQFVQEDFFHEKLYLKNYEKEPLPIEISFRFGSDFSDIFEVRGLTRATKGTLQKVSFIGQQSLKIAYQGLDAVQRTSIIEFGKPYYKSTQDGTVFFQVTLAPGQDVTLDYSIYFEQNNKPHKSFLSYFQARELLEPAIRKNNAYFPVLETSNEQFNHWLHRSQADLVSLMADTPYGKYPYAGVPWYNTAFGRDGLITALQVLWMAPDLAKDVLLFLSAYQADSVAAATDAEPGKILHETRQGEMVALNEVPFRQYYGTIDATPLYLILAGAYFDRTADLETIKSIWPNILAAINWINEYGDLDGDGFVEYKHKAENGLTNQAWKDSFDAVFHATGALADPPLALCEVQGYVYAAKVYAAKLAAKLEENDLALRLSKEAELLKVAFNRDFWDEELECFVLALDKDKQPCRVKSSNAGQLLFTGIVAPELAAKLVNTLMQPDMFNGWGIRTISSNESRYNPMSYHNGSVWPHDVSLIAMGFARYGFKKEAAELTTGLFDASLFIALQRLPELFCGFERRKGEAPTAYPVACSPQAWSVSAVFLMLYALLQIEIDPERKEISFRDPYLPSYLENVMIRALRVGSLTVELEINRQRDNNQISVYWKNQPKDWKLILIR